MLDSMLISEPRRRVNGAAAGSAILTEYDSLNPALCGQAVGATSNGVKCP
jgi:hypothetical protein